MRLPLKMIKDKVKRRRLKQEFYDFYGKQQPTHWYGKNSPRTGRRDYWDHLFVDEEK